jgi:hypothetical protein
MIISVRTEVANTRTYLILDNEEDVLLISDCVPQILASNDDELQQMASAKQTEKAANCARFVDHMLGSSK